MKAGAPDQPTERQQRYLRRIDESCQMLDLLLNDLLVFFRLESGQMQLAMGEGSAMEAVRSAMSALEPTAAGRQVSLATRDESDATFHADPQRVQQIVLNLLSNAIKFTPKGGSVTMSCGCAASGPTGVGGTEGPWVRIDVDDTGVGIPEHEVARMFEPFVRGGERGGGAPGTGLGLAISQRLALMMSGRITVQSAPGGGTRFTLWLRGKPAEKAAASPLGMPGSSAKPGRLPQQEPAGSSARH
jgi:signal transduction histidine kinase